MSIKECKLLEFPKISDPRGNLTFIEELRHIPFKFKRVYYLYDVPGGSERGGHAHKNLHQILISLSGSFDVVIHDGIKQKKIQLNSPSKGLYIKPMIWRELKNFSSGAVCFVLASDTYIESDYYRDFEIFKKNIYLK
ncbi:FdtA/QdtA family cupin domain-containing protein [Methylophilaceae bacterium]|nr:FdtA/QdtA family cupin domain-containing protein [Methylophilaceae bacterium]